MYTRARHSIIPSFTPVLARTGLLVLLLGITGASAQQGKPPNSGDLAKEGYHLESGDVIQVRFFLNPELNDQIQIQPDGHASLQLIGDVALAGKTPSEASEMLEERYSHELKTPRVTVQVRSYAGQKVFVTGEVNHPGVVNLVGAVNVLGAIGEAGGIRTTGTRKSVVLIRKAPDGKPLQRKLTLSAHGKVTLEAALPLMPYDVVIVPARAITNVDRWVDDYIRQLSPANLVVGFQYLYNRTQTQTSVLPF